MVQYLAIILQCGTQLGKIPIIHFFYLFLSSSNFQKQLWLLKHWHPKATEASHGQCPKVPGIMASWCFHVLFHATSCLNFGLIPLCPQEQCWADQADHDSGCHEGVGLDANKVTGPGWSFIFQFDLMVDDFTGWSFYYILLLDHF